MIEGNEKIAREIFTNWEHGYERECKMVEALNAKDKRIAQLETELKEAKKAEREYYDSLLKRAEQADAEVEMLNSDYLSREKEWACLDCRYVIPVPKFENPLIVCVKCPKCQSPNGNMVPKWIFEREDLKRKIKSLESELERVKQHLEPTREEWQYLVTAKTVKLESQVRLALEFCKGVREALWQSNILLRHRYIGAEEYYSAPDWNPDAHVEVTLTVSDIRKLFKAIAKIEGVRHG